MSQLIRNTLVKLPGPIVPRRFYASKPYEVFNRSVKLTQRDHMAQLSKSENVEYLRDQAALKTIERLAFIKRRMPKVLDLGCHSGNFELALCDKAEDASLEQDRQLVRDKIDEILMVDGSDKMLHRWDDEDYNRELKVNKIVVDEEKLNHPLLKKNEFDAVISNLSLHWINELPQTLVKINNLLKPDGLFLASMICEDSIFELRTSLQLAELERKNGISMGRISPMIKVDDMTNLLKQAKFNMVTIDVEEIIINYPNIFTIMEDLQLMGENSANKISNDILSKEVLLSAQAIYEKFHGEYDDVSGKTYLPLTFRLMFMIGWKESSNQPKPLERGSGDINLKDILQ
ncbi:putative methyltransferase [Wickerhamomyces ciferrii]|uniref:Methyltransferase n=1 Tax=Wickerhamomyces ciferrii (strain ATCC 14091 / BCRC 22168 / CBS 111 / JCM 3599 / NBRC 0793 / NRRL Y-1031 F-60-10) TaxID=1206466 RepID=K0KEE1_WICCF|nr:putative methyltransferase [Wickerhamomyces ciferrii]CCH41261.1 putative methyltransferase [Wickerhamomyces ciferrii]